MSNFLKMSHHVVNTDIRIKSVFERPGPGKMGRLAVAAALAACFAVPCGSVRIKVPATLCGRFVRIKALNCSCFHRRTLSCVHLTV